MVSSTDNGEEKPCPTPPSSRSECQYPSNKPPSWWDDKGNIFMLLLLYTIQGIPMGLSASVPLLVQGRVSYSQQGYFSIVSLPFGLKVLWAPLVDSIFSTKFGRRKSWLVPTQMVCGVMMIYFGRASHIGDWVGETGGPVYVKELTVFFFLCFLLMATQDIAVDGWALTLLKPHNKVYASTTNTVGQIFGFTVAHLGFLTLNDPHSCRRLFGYVSQADPTIGLVPLSLFVRFWGFVIVMTTIVVAVFKAETSNVGLETSTSPRNTSPRVSPSSLRDNDYQQNCRQDLFTGGGLSTTEREREKEIEERASPHGVLRQRQTGESPMKAVKTKDDLFEERLNEMSLLNTRYIYRDVGTEEGPVAEERAERRKTSLKNREEDESQSVGESYRLVWEMMKLPSIRCLAVILLTIRIPFGTSDGTTQIKLMERGVRKQQLAMLSPLLVPLSLISPFIIGRVMRGPDPLNAYRWGAQLKLGVALLWTGVVAVVPYITNNSLSKAEHHGGDMGDSMSMLWGWRDVVLYTMLLAVHALNNIGNDLMFVSQIAFFARVADPLIGGSYMTILATLGNLGNQWPQVLSFWLLDRTTIRRCSPLSSESSPQDDHSVAANCTVVVDGYMLQIFGSVVIGVVWLMCMKGRLIELGRRHITDWRFPKGVRKKARVGIAQVNKTNINREEISVDRMSRGETVESDGMEMVRISGLRREQ